MTVVAESRWLWGTLLCVLLLVSVPLVGTWWNAALVPAWCVLGYTGTAVWSRR